MKTIDVIFLIGITTVASCLIIMPKWMNGVSKYLISSLIFVALVQVLFHGFYWHYLPAYLLILLMVMIAFIPSDDISAIKKGLLRFVLISMLLASILPWAAFPPIPQLTKPTGDHKLGTKVFRWIDSSRAEHVTPDNTDKRNVVVQAWYPTDENAQGTHAAYLDGLDNLPEKIGIIPRWVFDHYDQVNTHGILNAPISTAQRQWPVIIFMTGYGASRAFYTSVVTGLASHGYVVLAIDHPYEAMITQLANGQLVTTIEQRLSDDPDMIKFMESRLLTRVADIQFVINQLGDIKLSPDSFSSSLDQHRIGIAGHSLGGASAAAAMAFDPRLKAAANIDGTLYGELPKPGVKRPFLLLESKKDGTERFLRYENGNQRLFKHFGGGFRYEMPEADHYSFTDVPNLLAAPARLLAGRLLSFGNVPTKTQEASVDILDVFFQGALNNTSTDLNSFGDHYKGVIRKRVD